MQQIKGNFLESSSCFLLGYILSRFYTLMKKERRRYETWKKKEDKRKILHDLDHQLCNKKRYPSDHIRKMHLENGCHDAAVGRRRAHDAGRRARRGGVRAGAGAADRLPRTRASSRTAPPPRRNTHLQEEDVHQQKQHDQEEGGRRCARGCGR